MIVLLFITVSTPKKHKLHEVSDDSSFDNEKCRHIIRKTESAKKAIGAHLLLQLQFNRIDYPRSAIQTVQHRMSSPHLLEPGLQTSPLLTLSRSWWSVAFGYGDEQLLPRFAIPTRDRRWILNHPVLPLPLNFLKCEYLPFLLGLLHLLSPPRIENSLCWSLKRRTIFIKLGWRVDTLLVANNNRTSLSLGVVHSTGSLYGRGLLSGGLEEVRCAGRLL